MSPLLLEGETCAHSWFRPTTTRATPGAMSGLAGALTLGRGLRPDVDTVSRMLEALEGRRWGPRRIWGDAHAVLAYRYAGTPDCSDLQPVVDADSGIAIVVDAHLGNREKLRRQLGAPRDGDAHLILAAYARWGEGFVEHLDGEFAVVLVDRARRKVLLARDALGVKPLYVADTAGGLLFASTLPAVLAAGLPGRRRPRALVAARVA